MSIRKLRERLSHDESGMGIVEILVALMIFSIVVLGMSYSMLTMTRITGDAAARQTATNLAAAEIDRLKAISDAFSIKEDDIDTRQVTVDGITFSIATNTSWVGANGSTGKCGIGTSGTQLLYKRARVTVTWDGMFLKNPVRADTALAPGTRINDPATGTILVSVRNEAGTGQAGVAVAAAKTSGGAGITDTIDPTDSDGCTYILKAPPGTYNLTVTKTNYINTAQQLLPNTQSIVVTAGAATPVAIEADLAHTFTNRFAVNSTRTGIKLPSNLDITYFGKLTAGPFYEPTATASRKLYPVAAGYQAIAGNASTCAAVDPDKWAVSATKYAGTRAIPTPSTSGGSSDLPVGMGVAEVKMPATGGTFLTAVAQNVTTGGNPGCAAGAALTYAFATMPAGSTNNIALPFGVWKLYVGTASGVPTTQVTTGIVLRDAALQSNPLGGLLTGVAGGGGVASGTLTLDPRVTK